MDFGLGLVLSLTDRASGGLNGVIVTLNGLENACNSSNGKVRALGDALSSLSAMGAGLTTTITAPITAFMGKITQYGIARASFVENTHLAFTSIMSDAQKASDYMQELMSFAKTTPFTYEGITSVAQSLLNYGIAENQILSETEGKFGGILQALGDWAGATGRGESGLLDIADILGKISAEGKITADRIQQLQTRGLVATKIIGNMYNVAESDALAFIKTMSSTQFINDLVKGIEEGTDGINGATGKMAGQMENLKKTWVGAKDTFVSALKNAGLQLMGQYIDEFGVTRYKFLETMTASLNDISKAVKLIPGILQPTMDFIQNGMQKGSALVLKIATAWGKLSEVTQKRLSKILTVLTLTGPAMLLVSKVGGTLLKLFSGMNMSLLKLLPTFARFGLATGLLAVVWKSDFAGIRTNTINFCEGVKKSFETAERGINGSVTDLQDILKGLDREDFFDGLTLAIMRVQIVMRALVEGWNDYTLSEDTFLKAKELGVLPLIEALFDLKYRFGLFWKGFKRGFSEVSNELKAFFEGLAKNAKGTIFEKAFDSIANFFEKLSDNDPKAWEDFGYQMGKCAAKALILAPAIRAVVKAFKALNIIVPIVSTAIKGVTKIFGALKTVITAIPSIFAGIGKIFSDIVGFFQLVSQYGLSNTLTGLFGGVATTIAGIASVVVGAITAIASFVDMLINGFSWLKEILMVIGIALAAVGVVILGVPAAIAAAIAAAVAAVATAVVLVVQYWDELVQFFSDAWTSITTTLAPVGEFFNNVWNAIVSGVTTILKPVWDMLVGMWNSLASTVLFCKDRIVEFANHIWETLQNTWNNIMSYIQPMIDDFNNLMATFKEFADFIGKNWTEGMKTIGDFFSGLWTTIEPYVTAITSGLWDAFVGFWTLVYEAICPILNVIWDTICGIFMSIWDGLVEILEGLWDFLVGIFDGIVDIVIGPIQGVWQFVSNIFQSIMNLIMGKPQEALENLKSALMGIVNAIAAPFKGLWKIIKGALVGVYKVVEGAIKGLVGIGANLVKGLIKGVKAAWDGLVSFFSGIINGIINFVKGLFGIHSPSTVFSEIGKFLVEGLKNGVEAVWNIITTLFTTVLNGLKTLVVNMFNGICTAVKTIWNGIKTFFSTIWEGIKTIFTTVLNAIKTVVSTVFNAIKTTVTTIFNAIKTFVSTVWNSIKTIISTVLNAIKTIFSTIFGTIKTVVTTIFNTIKTTITTVINSIKAVINTVFTAIKTIITNILNGIKTIVTNVWNGIKTVITTVINGIKNTINTVFKSIKTIITNIINDIKTVITNVFNAIKTFVTNTWNSIKNTINTVWNGIKTIVSGAVNAVKNTVSTVFNTVKNTVSTVWNGIKSSISTAWTNIKNVFSNAGQVFQTIVDKIKQPFTNIANWFKDKFTTAWTNVKNVFSKGGQIFVDIKNGVLDGLKNVINGLIDGINTVIAVPFNGLNSALNGIKNVNIAGAKPFDFIPTISVPQIPKLALGGVVTQPTTALIGEAGKEAVVPLERNTTWLDNLATMLNERLVDRDASKRSRYIKPEYQKAQEISNVYNNEGTKKYYTRNVSDKKEEHYEYDYSVVFNTGAIQIIAKDTSDAEAKRLALRIMEFIKREQELRKMMSYS